MRDQQRRNYKDARNDIGRVLTWECWNIRGMAMDANFPTQAEAMREHLLRTMRDDEDIPVDPRMDDTVDGRNRATLSGALQGAQILMAPCKAP